MSPERDAAKSNLLLGFLMAYMVGSFIHHFHNAQFIDEYPNMNCSGSRWSGSTRLMASSSSVTTSLRWSPRTRWAPT